MGHGDTVFSSPRLGKRVYGHTIPAHAIDKRIVVTKEPVGVCGDHAVKFPGGDNHPQDGRFGAIYGLEARSGLSASRSTGTETCSWTMYQRPRIF